MGEMMHLMRQMLNQSSHVGGSPTSHGMRSQSIDESMNDGAPGPQLTLQPVQFIQDLQLELFGERDCFSPDPDILGDVVSQGIVDAKLSLRLMELYVSSPSIGYCR